MMRALALACALALAPLSSGCTEAHASPREMVAQLVPGVTPASEYALMMLLNGEPTLVGVLTSTGTSVNNTTTGVTFSVSAGNVYVYKCDAGQANVGGGTTCDTTVTNANHKWQIANAWEPYFLVLKSSTICLDAPAATTINCAVFRMQGP